MTYVEAKQEAARAEIKLGQLTVSTWSRATVQPILDAMSTPALRVMFATHSKFAGIFTAGQQVRDWSWETLKAREGYEGREERS